MARMLPLGSATEIAMRVRVPSGRRMAARATLARSMAFCTILRTSSVLSVPPASGPTRQPSAAAAPLRGAISNVPPALAAGRVAAGFTKGRRKPSR